MSLPDTDALWMPFTANRQFKASAAPVRRRKGMYYTRDDGRRVLDGTAGLWCVNAGHGRARDRRGGRAQAARARLRAGLPDGPPARLRARRRARRELAPAGLDHVFFTNSGSESVDTALKIALAYHRARGEGHAHAARSAASAAITASASAASRSAASCTNRKPFGRAAAGRRSSAAHARPRAQRLHARPAGARRASSPTSSSASSRCTTPRPSPP